MRLIRDRDFLANRFSSEPQILIPLCQIGLFNFEQCLQRVPVRRIHTKLRCQPCAVYHVRTTIGVTPPASELRDRERVSRQNIVATLRLRIKNLEEKNRELTGLLELVYGELAVAREQNVSVGSAPSRLHVTQQEPETGEF